MVWIGFRLESVLVLCAFMEGGGEWVFKRACFYGLLYIIRINIISIVRFYSSVWIEGPRGLDAASYGITRYPVCQSLQLDIRVVRDLAPGV